MMREQRTKALHLVVDAHGAQRVPVGGGVDRYTGLPKNSSDAAEKRTIDRLVPT